MFGVISKMFDLLSAKEKGRLYLLSIALIFMAGIEMAGVASIMPFMAVVAKPEVVHSNRWLQSVYNFFEFEQVQSFLFFLGIVVLVLLVCSTLFKALTSWLFLRYDNRLNYMLGRRLLAMYLARPYVYFLNRNTADMGKNVLTEVRSVIAGVLSPGMRVLSNSLICLCILGLLLAVDPAIAITIALVLGGTYAVIYSFARGMLKRIGAAQVSANYMKYKVAGEALTGIKDLKILGCENTFLERYSVFAKRHATQNATAGVVAQIPRYVLELFAFGGILLIVLYFLSSNQDISQMIPLLALYAFAGYRLLPALQQIFSGITSVRFNSSALDVLHRDMVELIDDTNVKRLLVAPQEVKSLPFNKAVELRDIIFTYSGAKAPAVNGINLTILPNTTIGFAGTTGSGKTTIIDLILGLLSPSSGEMMVDGVNINEANMRRWQRNLGYVSQHIYLCDDTLVRNIAFGVPEEQVDREKVVSASKIANLHDFVEKELPLGYETIIGERGVRLSGGQRQRIGIARALYRDPAVLVMDEATSALDGVTEGFVMGAINNISKSKTILLVAHRLSTLFSCDCIYLFENGKITESGTYHELIRSSVWFRSSVSAAGVDDDK